MQKPLRLILVAILIVLGFWAWRTLFPSPEKVIRSRLRKLAAIASFKVDSGTIPKAYKASQIPDYFTPDVVIHLNAPGYEPLSVDSRNELQEYVTAEFNRLDGLKIEFLDINVKLGADKQTAIANLTGKATVNGARDFSVQEFNFLLRKIDGKWLIYRVETVKTLSRLTRHGEAPAGVP